MAVRARREYGVLDMLLSPLCRQATIRSTRTGLGVGATAWTGGFFTVGPPRLFVKGVGRRSVGTAREPVHDWGDTAELHGRTPQFAQSCAPSPRRGLARGRPPCSSCDRPSLLAGKGAASLLPVTCTATSSLRCCCSRQGTHATFARRQPQRPGMDGFGGLSKWRHPLDDGTARS